VSGDLGETSLTIVLIFTLVFGLLIGSFLNVVIYRLPLQLQLVWRHDALDFLGQKPEEADFRKFGLVFPPSRCPHCETPISPWQNIPVFSYLLLRGRCRACAEPISIQYPLVELICGILSAYVIYQFGLTSAGILALIFTWLLIVLTGIDMNHRLLPDSLTLLLLWLGLLTNSAGIFTDPNSAIIGASAGYLALWGIYWAFKLLTGKEGMGYGDFKLAAALGAWLGWQQLPLVLLLSSLVGAVIGTLMLLLQKKDRQTHIAYGPYLAIAGWIALVSGDRIMATYLSTF
jgi:leader peptidase (prepilin peptidase) / N-methyltransferase